MHINLNNHANSILAFPPQPTEEDSSSTDPNNAINDSNNNEERVNAGTPGGLSNSILSDSDDRHSYAFTFKVRQHSYFVSTKSCEGPDC